jgi:hypothetical protein
MLPNARLMIAATLASVVALICGFGVFAAFRVSYEPLGRVPSAAARLQLAAANGAAPPIDITAAEPFDRRFQIGGAESSISALAYSAPQPAEQPTMKVVVPAADDREHDNAEAEPKQSDDADAPMSSPQTAAAEAAEATKPADAHAATEATGTQEPASAPSVAAIDPANTESTSELQPQLTPPAAETQTAAPESTPERLPPTPETDVKAVDSKAMDGKAVDKKTERPREAARTHRAHKTRVVTTVEQNFFQAVPADQWRPAQKQPAKTRHAKVTSHTTAEPNSAAGGPLVSAPRQ